MEIRACVRSATTATVVPSRVVTTMLVGPGMVRRRRRAIARWETSEDTPTARGPRRTIVRVWPVAAVTLTILPPFSR